MPGPGNSRIPTLSTFAEIGRFCNPVTTTTTAVICNALLRSVIQELLENARTKAFDAGRKDGYDEGRYLANEDEEKVRSTTLEEGRREGYEKGLREGEEKGRTAEREEGQTKRVNGSMQTEPEIKVTTDTSTQTTPATPVDAVMQTAPNNEPPRLLNDAGTSTETSSTCETDVQANETPTSPSLPQLAATSLLTTPTQPPSAPSTTPSSSSTATTTAPLASEHSPAARIRRQSLLAQPTTSQTSPQHHP